MNDVEHPRMIYQKERIAHWDEVARRLKVWEGWGGYYHQRLTSVYQFLVPPRQRVLEIGCGRGDLLAALGPAVGVGIDFSGEMIQQARERHPDLRFIQVDAHEIELNEPFDVIILSDVLNDLWDVQAVFERILSLSRPHTRILINSYSRLWQLPLNLARRLKVAKPILYQNWLTVEDIGSSDTVLMFSYLCESLLSQHCVIVILLSYGHSNILPLQILLLPVPFLQVNLPQGSLSCRSLSRPGMRLVIFLISLRAPLRWGKERNSSLWRDTREMTRTR